MRRITILFALLMLFGAGCKKKDQAAPVPPSFFIVDQQSAKPYQIATLTAVNLTLTSEKYEGTFNGSPLTLGGSGSTLAFMVPDVAAGTYDVEVKIDNVTHSFKYTVEDAPAISDPSQYLHDALASARYSDAELEQMKANVTRYPGADSNGTTMAQIDALKNIYADMEQQLAAATDEEKAVAAKIIAANPTLFTRVAYDANPTRLDSNGLGLFKTSGTVYTPEQIAGDLDRFITSSCKMIIGACAVNLLVLNVAPAHFKLAAALTVGATAGLIYVVNSKLIEGTAQAIFRFDALTMKEITRRKSTAAATFTNGEAYKMNITSRYQNLNKNCSTDNSTTLISISNALDEFGNVWNRYFGKLSSWFNIGKPYHFKNVTRAASKQLSVNAKYLSIKNISNSKVTATTENDNGQFIVKFSTTEPGSQDFTYDIVYECDGFAPFTQAMSGRILDEADFCSGFSGPGQIGGDFMANDIYQSTWKVACGDKYLYRVEEDMKRLSKYDNHGKLIATIAPFSDNKAFVGIAFYGGSLWCEAQEGTNPLTTKDQTLVKIDPGTGAVTASVPMSNADIGIDGSATVNTYVFATEDGLYTLVDKSTFSTTSCKLYRIDTATGARTFVKSTTRPYISNIAYSSGYLYIQTLNKVVRMPVGGSDATQTEVADYYAKYSASASVKLVALCGKMYAFTRKLGSTDPLDVNKLN